MRLFVLHQGPGKGPLPGDAPTWRTCLRELAFVDEWCRPQPYQHLLVDDDAYELLLEVVCGLRSPLMGETEVQAQFKVFLNSLDPCLHHDVHRLGQRILADAKYIRQHHLQGFGAHSYSSLAALHVPEGRHVALVGAGILAEQITVTLGKAHAIDQWARRPVDNRPELMLLGSAGARGVVCDAPTTLILAAPVRSAMAVPVVRCYPNLVEIIDLRSADERSSLVADVPVITLDDLFAEAASTCVPLARVGAARRDVARLARAFALREQLRPLGWDDLCA